MEEQRVDSIICAVTCGKDSLATIDICCRRFNRVEAFFLYTIRDLPSQQSVFAYVKKRYGVSVWQIPHQDVFRVLDYQLFSYFRPSLIDQGFPNPTQRQMYDLAREHFGIQWVATGEKKNDNMLRRACMMLRGQWDWSRMCYYPLMDWSDGQVWKYLRMRHVPIPADYERAKKTGSAIRASRF